MIDTQELKTTITPTVVAQRYLGQPLKRINDKLWYKSPFRNERTASFVVSDEKGIHDFGSSEHYDIFSFIQKLFGLSFIESLKFLINDFGIQVDDTYLNKEKIEQLKEAQKQRRIFTEKIKKWYNDSFISLCISNKKVKDKLTKKPLDENLYNLDLKINLYIELFLNARTFEDMEILYKNEREEVEKLGILYE